MDETKDLDSSLKEIYYSPAKAASFSRQEALKYAHPDISNKALREWLSQQETHSIHKPVRKSFERRKVITSGIDGQWQADLADLQSLSRYNKGYKYLLGCIDVFSRFAWVVPLKNKSAGSIQRGLQSIFADGRKPKKLQTDMGTEFTNSTVQTFLKKENVDFFFTQNQDIKASLIERFWRTFKGKMFRYFTHNDTKKYFDVLGDLVNSYNNTYHRSIRLPPAKVNSENESEIWQRLYGSVIARSKSTANSKLKIGSYVRISKLKAKFEKGYLPNWSREIFIIKEIKNTEPPTLVIEDQNREEMKGTFYCEELQLIEKMPKHFRIEKIISKRVRRGKKQCLVKWADYPVSFNSWVELSSVIKE